MIPRDHSDELDLVLAESRQLLAVSNHVERVLVVTAVADEQSDVVHDRRTVAELPSVVTQAVQRCGAVEEFGCQLGCVLRVFRVRIEVSSQAP